MRNAVASATLEEELEAGRPVGCGVAPLAVPFGSPLAPLPVLDQEQHKGTNAHTTPPRQGCPLAAPCALDSASTDDSPPDAVRGSDPSRRYLALRTPSPRDRTSPSWCASRRVQPGAAEDLPPDPGQATPLPSSPQRYGCLGGILLGAVLSAVLVLVAQHAALQQQAAGGSKAGQGAHVSATPKEPSAPANHHSQHR